MTQHTFTRAELYALVWAEPMIKVAEKYGVSGNGLAKACQKAGIPVPERGYWAKLQAGKAVKQPPLQPTPDGQPDTITITPPGPRYTKPPKPESVQATIAAELASGTKISVAKTLANSHWAIEKWIDENRQKREIYRTEPYMLKLYAPLERDELSRRQLLIMSALFKALENRGYTIKPGYSHNSASTISRDHLDLEVHISEREKQVRRELTREERKSRGYYAPEQKWTQERVKTGELILRARSNPYFCDKLEWRETTEVPLDDKLQEVLADIAGAFEEGRLYRQRKAEEEKQHRKSEEIRHRQEMDRKRESIRLQRLVLASESHRKALQIRNLIAAVEASALKESDHFEDWKAWALAHAERIDPLNSEDIFDRSVSDYDVYGWRDD